MSPDEIIKTHVRNLPRVATIVQDPNDEDARIEVKGNLVVEHDDKGKAIVSLLGHPLEIPEIVELRVIARTDEPGKTIAVELPELTENFYWYDAHNCDGQAPAKRGWYLSDKDLT